MKPCFVFLVIISLGLLNTNCSNHLYSKKVLERKCEDSIKLDDAIKTTLKLVLYSDSLRRVAINKVN